MLRFFRKHARGWFMIAITGYHHFCFCSLFRFQQRQIALANAIAIIDRKIISEAEFHNEYEKLLDMTQTCVTAAKLTPEILKKMDLKRKAYNDLTNRQVIIAKAADLKIQVSDEELRNMTHVGSGIANKRCI